MIFGAHIIVYSKNAEADRAFFRDVLKFASVDAGHGSLIFSLPPAETAIHPSEDNGAQEVYFMCDDLQAEIERPLFDTLGLQKTCLGKNLQMFAYSRLAHPKFLRDEQSTDAILDQIPVDLPRKMGCWILEPIQDFNAALVRQCSRCCNDRHIAN